MVSTFQYPGLLRGFSCQTIALPGNTKRTRSGHPSRFTSMLKFKQELLYSVVENVWGEASSCRTQPGAANQKAPAIISGCPSRFTSATATPSEIKSLVSTCFVKPGCATTPPAQAEMMGSIRNVTLFRYL